MANTLKKAREKKNYFYHNLTIHPSLTAIKVEVERWKSDKQLVEQQEYNAHSLKIVAKHTLCLCL